MTIIKCMTSLNLKSSNSIPHVNSASVSNQMGNNENSGLIFAIVGGTLGLFGGLLSGIGGGAVDGLKEGLTTALARLIKNPTSILTP